MTPATPLSAPRPSGIRSAVLLARTVFILPGHAATSPGRAPNIVILLADDLGRRSQKRISTDPET